MTRSSLGTINPNTTSGTQLAAMLSARDNAENTGHAGTGRPTYAQQGMIYTDDSYTPPRLFLAIGTAGPDLDLTSLFATRPGTLSVTSEVRLPPAVGGIFPYLWADGTAWPRISYPALYDAICPTFTGTVTNASTSITAVSENLIGLGLIGAKIEGSGIPVGATVVAIPTATTITLSVAAVATTVATTLRIFPHGNGNGSTTFNVPNCKDRVVLGRGNMNNSADAGLITVAGGAGFDGTVLGAVGGVQSVILTAAHLPAHGHTASGTGSLVSGSTGLENANHYHGISGQTDVQGVHQHTPSAPGTFVTYQGTGGNAFTIGGGTRSSSDQYTNPAGAHAHNVNLNTGLEAVAHGHAITSLVLSVGVTVNASTGGGGLHTNVQPGIIENVVVKT